MANAIVETTKTDLDEINRTYTFTCGNLTVGDLTKQELDNILASFKEVKEAPKSSRFVPRLTKAPRRKKR